MSESRPYLRAQPRHWWAHAPYRAYTIRELSGVGLALYAAILLAGLVSLARGPAAFETYRQFLASPLSLLIHLLLLTAAVWHMWTWFQILPKTMPKLVWRGRLIPQDMMSLTATAVAIASSLFLLALFVIVGAYL